MPPVQPEFHQIAAADSRCLTDEFPFSYSIAKELPHIFGNVDDDEVLDRPLTPSFEPPTECESWWDSMALESDHYHGNSARSPGPSCSNLNRPYEMLSPPRIGELSCGLMPKGRSFRFFRQE
ncbi:hypothetical protein OS493_027874 [Desmophyllum pertusum]|uniref:Uncharacterized protein n=1 Tax=Desmophyllum pertusum TaxID=174260 RepID=A0A9W9YKN2_9CNID|nr:hypothetical protein OS493_027874 [Desmophyllum pertusum]